MIKKILVSQPAPSSDKSPYFDLAERNALELTFKPFIRIEGISTREFRDQRVNILAHTAIVFNSTNAIDHFFTLCKELRVTLPEDMKYFGLSEKIVLYIQKYVQYRKRKVFFGTSGKIDDLVPSMVKHKTEKYLVPLSDVANDNVTKLLDSKGLNHKECCMYRTVSNNFTDEEIKAFDYDMLVFFSPSGLKALKENFPKMKAGEVKIAAFGPATAKAVKDMGLTLDLEAPTEKYPSMPSALRRYLIDNEE